VERADCWIRKQFDREPKNGEAVVSSLGGFSLFLVSVNVDQLTVFQVAGAFTDIRT